MTLVGVGTVVVGVVIINFVKIVQVFRGLKGPKNTKSRRKVTMDLLDIYGM